MDCPCDNCNKKFIADTQHALDTHLRCSKIHKNLTRNQRKAIVDKAFPNNPQGFKTTGHTIEERALKHKLGMT